MSEEALNITWEMVAGSTNKPKVYDYNKSTGVYSESDIYWSWATGNVFDRIDACIKGKNNTTQNIKINSVTIGTLSCNAGGTNFYWWNGSGYSLTNASYAKGYGGTYYSKIRVKSPGSSTFEESSVGTATVANVITKNLYYVGSSSSSAAFGPDLVPRTFNLSTSPTIKPGDTVYLHFGVSSFNGSKSETIIKFSLKTDEMVVNTGKDKDFFVWRYDGTKWVLDREVKVYKNSTDKWVTVDKPGIYVTT